MFQKRKNFKKPPEELFSPFKDGFQLAGSGPQAGGPSQQHSQQMMQGLPPPDASTDPRKITSAGGGASAKGGNTLTPRAKDDQWSLTPSLLDPTLLGLNLPENTPGASSLPSTNALFPRAVGDLHLANSAIDVLTPTVDPASVQFDSVSFQWGTTALPSGQVVSRSQVEHVHLGRRFSEADLRGQSAFSARNVLTNIDYGNVDLALGLPAAVPSHVTAPTPDQSLRYHATLHTPTAMVETPGEDPMTYLNKGQQYSLTVEDRGLQLPTFHLPRYRTYVWISFNDAERRAMPDACWHLWKDGRGINEAQQSSNRLLAVEFVPTGGGVDEVQSRPAQMTHVEIEGESYNGFSVLWGSTTSSPRPECAISLRFNFVSTDFTRSKGVKGIPVRLCTRTEEISPDNIAPAVPEVSYCVVQVFRDHGAARKITNDMSQLNRKIEKLKNRVDEPGVAKRRRSKYDIALDDEDRQTKLAQLQSKLSSARAVSILNLRGDDSDLPRFSSSPGDDKMEDVQHSLAAGTETVAHQSFTSVESVPQAFGDTMMDALDIDTAVAQFYIRTQSETYYRAIYLTQLTLDNFISTVTAKYSIDASQVHIVLHVDHKGRQIVVDDEVVRAFPEGQDMIVEFWQQSDSEGDEKPGELASSPGMEIKLFF